MSEPEGAEYLGDGVSATFDGWHVWLHVERFGDMHRIALEPAVFRALCDYYARVWREANSSADSEA